MAGDKPKAEVVASASQLPLKTLTRPMTTPTLGTTTWTIRTEIDSRRGLAKDPFRNILGGAKENRCSRGDSLEVTGSATRSNTMKTKTFTHSDEAQIFEPNILTKAMFIPSDTKISPCSSLVADLIKFRHLIVSTSPRESTASAMATKHLSQKFTPKIMARALVTTTILMIMKRNSSGRVADLPKTQGVRRFVLLARLSKVKEPNSAIITTGLSQKTNL